MLTFGDVKKFARQYGVPDEAIIAIDDNPASKGFAMDAAFMRVRTGETVLLLTTAESLIDDWTGETGDPPPDDDTPPQGA